MEDFTENKAAPDLLDAVEALVDAMETCHQCKGTLTFDDVDPAHCEDCSCDCDNHDEPPCASIGALHGRVKTLLNKAKKTMATKREQDIVDVAFQALLLATSPGHSQKFLYMQEAKKAEWLRRQLEACGIHTEPRGMSWGVIVDGQPAHTMVPSS